MERDRGREKKAVSAPLRTSSRNEPRLESALAMPRGEAKKRSRNVADDHGKCNRNQKLHEETLHVELHLKATALEEKGDSQRRREDSEQVGSDR